MYAGSLTRPRSSVWHNTAAEPNLLEGIDEGPVKSRTARAPLTAPALSPRAPWLQATALTAAKFRQPSRQQTARAVERAHMRVQVCCAMFNMFAASVHRC